MAKFKNVSTKKAQTGRVIQSLFWLLLFAVAIWAWKEYAVDYAPNKYARCKDPLDILAEEKNYFIFDDEENLLSVTKFGAFGDKTVTNYAIDRILSCKVSSPPTLAWFNAGEINVYGINHMGSDNQYVNVTLGIFENPTEVANALIAKLDWHEEFKISVEVDK